MKQTKLKTHNSGWCFPSPLTLHTPCTGIHTSTQTQTALMLQIWHHMHHEPEHTCVDNLIMHVWCNSKGRDEATCLVSGEKMVDGHKRLAASHLSPTDNRIL